MAEQVLGRTHRPGQQADELVVNTCHTIAFDHMNFGACLSDSMYQHLVDHRRKLIYASYTELPKIFPSGFLSERGFETVKLSKDQEQQLKVTFGG